MESKNLLIICITIIIVITMGLFVALNIFKTPENTQINILTKQNITQGETLKLKLSTNNGKCINNEIIELDIIYKLNKSTYHNLKIKTDENGEVKVNNLEPGNYIIVAKYIGTKSYKQCNLTYNLKVKYKRNTKHSNEEYATDYKADEVIDGWDPTEHEVSRENIGDGNQRITYDDGYFRVIDKDGNILNYGY